MTSDKCGNAPTRVDMDDEGKGTLDRSRKDSFWWYKRCIASDGEDLA